jgi:hypothetical protein
VKVSIAAGLITIMFLGYEEQYYLPLTEKGGIQYRLKEVKLNRSLNLIAEDSTTYIHRGGKR